MRESALQGSRSIHGFDLSGFPGTPWGSSLYEYGVYRS